MKPFLTLISLALLSAAPVVQAQTTPGPEPSPIKYDAVLTTDADDLTSGGLNPGTQVFANLDLTAIWQGGDGWYAKGYVIDDLGGNFSQNRVGDAQTVDNIDAPPAWHLIEAYVRRVYDDGHLVSSFGLMNLNGVFDVQKPGRLFLNSSHGIGPDYSQSGPSIFPVTSLGTMTTWIPDKNDKFRLGVFDGVPGDPAHPSTFVAIKLSKADGANIIGEYEHDFTHSYLQLGHWGYTARYTRLDGTMQRGNSGSFAQYAFTTSDDTKNFASGLNGWVRYGTADARVNPIDQYAGGGLTWPAPWGGDQMGVAVADAHFSRDYRAVTPGTGAAETTWEATFSHGVNDHITVQPDVQYVVHPSGQRSVRNALVLGVRLVYDVAGG